MARIRTESGLTLIGDLGALRKWLSQKVAATGGLKPDPFLSGQWTHLPTGVKFVTETHPCPAPKPEGCGYCGKEYSPGQTRCDGCGAPRKARAVHEWADNYEALRQGLISLPDYIKSVKS